MNRKSSIHQKKGSWILIIQSCGKISYHELSRMYVQSLHQTAMSLFAWRVLRHQNIPALEASSLASLLETDIVSIVCFMLSPINIMPEGLKGGNSERADIASGSTSIHCPVSCFCFHSPMNCVHAFLFIESTP